MTAARIHPDTRIGEVSLRVKRIERALDYYVGALGMGVIENEGGTAQIGADGLVLLELVETPHGRIVEKTAGLYHFALCLPGRRDLAYALKISIANQVLIVGVADHGVSEAIYLQDPDGNGIEIYRDRPRGEWPESGGELYMVTEPLDVDGLLALAKDRPASQGHPPLIARMGHVHVHVSDLSAAERFYGDVLGFELRQRYRSSAAFFAAGGYHHHIGLNTWAGVGAPPAPEDALGLNWYSIRLPDQAALESVVARVKAAGIKLAERGDGYFLRDPSENQILLTLGASA